MNRRGWFGVLVALLLVPKKAARQQLIYRGYVYELDSRTGRITWDSVDQARRLSE